METELELLNAARRMDTQALVKIFDLYSSALYKYALRLYGDPVLADQIVGDVFAKLLEQLSAGNGPRKNLRSYLYETTYHRLIDELRYSTRTAPLESAALLWKDPHTAFLSIEDRMVFQQVLHALHHKLTEDQRDVIILRFLEGLSLRDTAAIMNQSVGNVKVIQGRALAKLRRSVEYQELRKSLPSQRIRMVPKPLGI
jgi:RNA polymerase sigma-70 factor, ECF subfamily